MKALRRVSGALLATALIAGGAALGAAPAVAAPGDTTCTYTLTTQAANNPPLTDPTGNTTWTFKAQTCEPGLWTPDGTPPTWNATDGTVTLTGDTGSSTWQYYFPAEAEDVFLRDVKTLSYVIQEDTAGTAPAYKLFVQTGEPSEEWTGQTDHWTALNWEFIYNNATGERSFDGEQTIDIANGVFWSSRDPDVMGDKAGPGGWNTLDYFLSVFPNARVIGIGVGIGAGQGTYTVNSVTLNSTTYEGNTLAPLDSCSEWTDTDPLLTKTTTAGGTYNPAWGWDPPASDTLQWVLVSATQTQTVVNGLAPAGWDKVSCTTEPLPTTSTEPTTPTTDTSTATSPGNESSVTPSGTPGGTSPSAGAPSGGTQPGSGAPGDGTNPSLVGKKSLPATGANVAPFALGAMVLLGAGAGLIAWRRRQTAN